MKGLRVKPCGMLTGSKLWQAARRCATLDYYGLDVHKQYSVYVRTDEAGRVVEEGRIANTPKAVAALLASAQGEAMAVQRSVRTVALPLRPAKRAGGLLLAWPIPCG